MSSARKAKRHVMLRVPFNKYQQVADTTPVIKNLVIKMI